MTRRQNLHYKISSQHKLKSEDEYFPKSAQIKLELTIEKGTKEGEACIKVNQADLENQQHQIVRLAK